MTAEILQVLVLLGVGLVFFTTEWLAADVTALALLVVVTLLGLLPADEAFLGFGSDTVVSILALLILTAALRHTGVVAAVGRVIIDRFGEHPMRLLTVITLSAAAIGAFISNTASTAFFLPIAVAVALRAGESPSKFLMPIAFAGILTSSVTLVSTSTNIVVSGLMTQHDMQPMGMFELAPVGIPIAMVGLAYVLLLGRRMIPEREPKENLVEEYGLSNYLAEVVLSKDSDLVGESLGETRLWKMDVQFLAIARRGQRLTPRESTTLKKGDVLLVEGPRDQLLEFKEMKDVELRPDVSLGLDAEDSPDVRLAEVVLLPRATLVGSTLRRHRFAQRHGLQVLAINRHRERIVKKMSDVRLRAGDILLVQGHRDNLAALEDEPGYRVLGAEIAPPPHLKKAPIAVAIFALALAAATFDLASLPVAVLAGVVAVFATGCLTPQQAYREVDWRVLVLIASMLGFGHAMETTGTAEYLASGLVRLVGESSPRVLLGGFFVLTVILTQPMSNQAAAVLVVPVALETARQLDLEPRAFAMMIALAASTSYMTPLEPACLMVYGPGGYRFRDFPIVGGPLTLLILAISIFLVPLVWPLTGGG
jgi:di/tricarboxylate transporter